MINPGSLAGLIFDFNGVLFLDDHLQRKSWRRFATDLRDTPLSDQEINVHIHGRNGQYTMEYLLGHPISRDEADNLTEGKEKLYRQMCLDLRDGFKLSPGAIELLSRLETIDIPFTIASASPKANVYFFIEHLRLATWFDIEKIVYDDGKIPGKPAPDIYLQAAQNIGLGPDQCVVVEDSQSGILAAHNAGIGHVIALGPIESHRSLAKIPGVKQVVENLSQIPIDELFL